ncbi:hypothetical protein V1525DRAFT_340462 [Lipomyces kononenkoae]|uniref:Uncharacterized protein n=1 Tax=Lipomyces kononenkoae TaxID=34357 RepID=A0ACC3T5F9_LIPKO
MQLDEAPPVVKKQKKQSKLNLARSTSGAVTSRGKRPRDEDVFAAAVAKSTKSNQPVKKQKLIKFSSVLEDELLSDDEDEDLDDEGDDDIIVGPDERVVEEPEPEPEADPALAKFKVAKPPRKKFIVEPRSPTNAPEISVLVMFRAKFSELYDGVPDLGPQDFEEGIVADKPTHDVDAFMCRTLSLVLNRKKYIEPGHSSRAIEEAISTHGSAYWGQHNHNGPFRGGYTFVTLDWNGRLEFLMALMHWSLISSDGVRKVLSNGYSGNRLEDDRNCELAVSPIGMDSERRRYYLVEGLNDTRFRLFRETNPRKRFVNWTSVASTHDELRRYIEELKESDTSRHGKALTEKLAAELPRLEAGEQKRKRQSYRTQRKQIQDETAAAVAEFGGMYRGRTRGKRVNYNAGEGEQELEDYLEEEEGQGRRQGRISTRRSSPTSAAVYTTASGRASRRPAAGLYDGVDPDKLDRSLLNGAYESGSDDAGQTSNGMRTRQKAAGNAADADEYEDEQDDDLDYNNEQQGQGDDELSDEDYGSDRQNPDYSKTKSRPVVLRYRSTTDPGRSIKEEIRISPPTVPTLSSPLPMTATSEIAH